MCSSDLTVTFVYAPDANDSIYISVQNHGGNYLLYDKTYSISTSTNKIVLATEDNVVKDILVFVNGVRMFEGVASNQFTHLTTSNLYTIGFNTNLSVGDFVRSMKQLIDLLNQVANAAPDLRAKCKSALLKIDRGVVAYIGSDL